MSTFAFVFLCIQACLVQNVFSQYCGAYGPGIAPAALYPAAPCGYGAGLDGFAYPGVGLTGVGLGGLTYPGVGFAGAYPGAGLAPYGGFGEGNVAVAGELPVAGTTAIGGQVPIMGAVGFSGPVAAAGSVSIAGQCACGCGSPYMY